MYNVSTAIADIADRKVINDIIKINFNNIFSKTYFSILDVQRLATYLKINLSMHSAYKDLRMLHCIDWDEMKPETVEFVVASVYDMFGVDRHPKPLVEQRLVIDEPVIGSTRKVKSFFRRISGRAEK